MPSMLTRGEENMNAPLCEKVVSLKYQVFPVKRGNGRRYFNWGALYNPEQSGIMQLLAPVEEELFTKSYAAMERWGDAPWSEAAIQDFYEEVNLLVTDAYQVLFNL